MSLVFDRMKISSVFLVILLFPFVSTFTANYCDGKESTIRMIDLTAPEKCPEPTKDEYEDERIMNTHIMQTDTDHQVRSIQCQVRITKEVTRCGFTSITYGNTFSAFEEVLSMSEKECKDLHDKEKLIYEGHTYKAALNEQTADWNWSHGKVKEDGGCDDKNFITEGQYYEKSFERVLVYITLKEVYGTFNPSNGMVRFDNGIRAHFVSGTLFDRSAGRMYWKYTSPSCEESVSEVYFGAAKVYKKTSALGKDKTSMVGSIVLVANNKTGQYAGLALSHRTVLCSTDCYVTQIDGIVACFVNSFAKMPSEKFKPRLFDEHTQIETEIGFLHLSSQMKMVRKFEEFQTHLCEVERKTLFNKLQAISSNMDNTALIDIFGEGHKVGKAGAVAYITKCVPVEVTKMHFGNCTHEIPVQYKEKPMFVDPITKILQPIPTIIPCSEVMKVRWKINGKWFCQYPKFEECDAPSTLNITIGEDQIHFDITDGVGKGVYSDEQIAQHAEYETFMSSRVPMLAKVTHAGITNGANGANGGLGLGLGLPLSLSEMDLLTKGFMGFIDPIANYLGQKWIWFTGFCVIISIVMSIVNFLHRVCFLYQRKGFGLWLFAAFFDSAFNMVSVPLHLLKTNEAQNQDQEELSSVIVEPRKTSIKNTEQNIPHAPDHVY